MTSNQADQTAPVDGDDEPEGPESNVRRRPRHAWPFPWWFVVAVIFVVIIAVRITLVHMGWLFGSARILTVDAVIGAALVVGMALGRQCSVRHPLGKPPPQTSALTDWLGVAAAVLGLPALVISLSNLFAPPTPNGLSPSACAGAPVYGWDYRGVTTGPIGNYARSGPGLSFPQTDRFDSGCTLGFAGYCLGDPVEEPFTHWLETRWLLVGRHTDEPAKTGARLLSAEPGDRRFVSHAYIAPKSPDSQLRYLGDEECARGRPQPGPVTMTAEPTTDAGVTFDLHVDHAERVGVALALPTGQLRAGSAVRRVYSEPTDASGNATITWNAPRTVQQLQLEPSAPLDITVLGIACLGPVGPADADTAGILTFTVIPDGTVTLTNTKRPDDQAIDNLRRAACDSEAYSGTATPAPTPSK